MEDELLAHLRRTIIAHGLFLPRGRVVVAVSGGADSVALLHLLADLRPTWHLSLHVAHLDHGLRKESVEDATFVQRLGRQLGLPATLERRDVSAICTQHGWSLEDGARRIRYAFLQEVADRQSASAIALAHTADDQAETVLMRLLRGTGLLGLGAIPIKRQGEDALWIVRPLLETWRKDLLAYLRRKRLSYREDATNADTHFVRNRIRHELLPLLERDYNPNIKGALKQLAEQSRWDYAYLEDAAGKQWKRTVSTPPAAPVAITIAAFLRQPKALQRQLVRRAIQLVRGDLGQFEFKHWLEVEQLFLSRPTGSVIALPGGVRLSRERDRVLCQAAEPPPVLAPPE